jgi:hypothetical protein
MDEQPNKPEQDSAQSPQPSSEPSEDMFATSMSDVNKAAAPTPSPERDDPFATRLDAPPSEAGTEERPPASTQPTELTAEKTTQPEPPPPAEKPKVQAASAPPTPSGTPVMSYIPGTVALGLHGGKTVKQVEISVRNSGDGVLQGQVVPAVDWLEVVGDSTIQCNPLEIKKFTIQLKTNTPSTPVTTTVLIHLTGNAGNMPPDGKLAINGTYVPLPKPKEGIVLLPETANFPIAMMEQLEQSVKIALTVENHTKETAKIGIQVNKPWLKLNTSVVTLEPEQSVPLTVSATPSEIPEVQQGAASATAMFRMVVEGKPTLSIQREMTVRVQRTGITQTARLTQWAMYIGVWLAGAFGLAAGMRIVTAIFIARDVAFFPLLLGIIGFAGPIGVYMALTKVGVLKNAQAQIDQIEDYYKGEAIAGSIIVPSVSQRWWHIGFIALLTVTGVLGGWLAGSPYTSNAGIWLGLFGGLLVGILGSLSGTMAPLSDSGPRDLKPEHLYRPVAVGIGLTMWAAALHLVGSGAWQIPLYTLILLFGMIGIAGASIHALPLRLHQWSGRLHIALMSGVAAIATMSLANMFLNGHSTEILEFVDGNTQSTDATFRMAYSPAYFVSTASDRSIILASLFGILLVIVGVVGAAIVMQAYGHQVVTDRRLGLKFSSILVAGLTVVMIPMLFIWAILAILPLGRTFEGWLIWGIPATILMLLLIIVRTRPQLLDKWLEMFHQNVSKMTFLPPFIRNPLIYLGTLRSSHIQPVVTWELGLVAVVVGSIVAAPFVLSFWFWILALGGYLFWIDKELASTTQST